jgi:hypothetical protein
LHAHARLPVAAVPELFGQEKHAEELVLGLKYPITQGKHRTLTNSNPAAHTLQVAADVEPVPTVDAPTGHVSHAVADPTLCLYVPTGQGWQSEPFEEMPNAPASQKHPVPTDTDREGHVAHVADPG